MKQHNDYIIGNDLSEDTNIYRMFSWHWFEHMVTSGSNALVRVKLWEDPYENFFMKCPIIDENGQIVSMDRVYNSYWGQCWTLTEESDALWRIYSRDLDGIKVCTTVGKLLQSLRVLCNGNKQTGCYMGRVEYKSEKEISDFLHAATFTQVAMGTDPKEFASMLLIKRDTFMHENEVRVIHNDNYSQVKMHPDVKHFTFDYNSILDEYVLDPRLDERTFETRKKVMVDLGCSEGKISKSSLYHFDPVNIRL